MMKKLLERMELLLEFPWVEVSDEKVIDLGFEKLRGREDMINKVNGELAKLDAPEKKKFIDILFTDYWNVMDRWGIFKDNFNILQETYGAGEDWESTWFNFEYVPPEQKDKLMLDFYLLSLMEEDSANPGINYAIRGAKARLMPDLKKELLDAVYFSVACEFRHCWDQTGNSDKSIEKIFTEKGMWGKVSKYINKFLGYRNKPSYAKTYGKMKPQPNTRQKDRPELPKFTPGGGSGEETNKLRMESYRAAKRTWEEDIDFLKAARVGYYDLDWHGGYGGKNWGLICDGWIHLNGATQVGDTAVWIDHVYALQHNTGSVFTKIEEYSITGGYGWLKKALDYKYNLKEPLDYIDKVSPDMQKLALAYNASWKPDPDRGQEDILMHKRNIPSLERWNEIKAGFKKGYGDNWNTNPDDLEYSAKSYEWSTDTANIKLGDIVDLGKQKERSAFPHYSVVRHIGKLGTAGEENSIWVDMVRYEKPTPSKRIPVPGKPPPKPTPGHKMDFGKPDVGTIIPIDRSAVKAVRVEKIKAKKTTTAAGTPSGDLDIGDQVEIQGSGSKYSITKDGSTGKVVKLSAGKVWIEFDKVTGSKTSTPITYDIDKEYVVKVGSSATDAGGEFNTKGKSLSDFEKGMVVKYVGDNANYYNKTGVVTGIDKQYVLVNFKGVSDSQKAYQCNPTKLMYSVRPEKYSAKATEYPTTKSTGGSLKVGDVVQHIDTNDNGKIVGRTKIYNYKVKWDNGKVTSHTDKTMKHEKVKDQVAKTTFDIGDTVTYAGTKPEMKKQVGNTGKITNKWAIPSWQVQWTNGKKTKNTSKTIQKKASGVISPPPVPPSSSKEKLSNDMYANIGDMVKITNPGHIYPDYEAAAIKMKAKKWLQGYHPKKGELGAVTGKMKHPDFGDVLLLISNDIGEEYVIKADATEEVEPPDNPALDIKVGDTVEYIGDGADLKGKVGKVTRLKSSDVAYVQWGPDTGELGVHLFNIKKVKAGTKAKASGLKVGDVVKLKPGIYKDDEANPGWGGDQGKIKGTIIRFIDSSKGFMNPIHVKWDNGENNQYKESDLEAVVGSGDTFHGAPILKQKPIGGSNAELKIGDKIKKDFGFKAPYDHPIEGEVVGFKPGGGTVQAKVKWENDTETLIDLDDNYEIINEGDIVFVKESGEGIDVGWMPSMNEMVCRSAKVMEVSDKQVKLYDGFWYNKNRVKRIK